MKKKIEVTSENFGDVLMQGLEEAIAVARGRTPPARVTRRKLTARQVEVALPPHYRPNKIAAVPVA
jgi:hypothetical protein